MDVVIVALVVLGIICFAAGSIQGIAMILTSSTRGALGVPLKYVTGE
ncbi:MAG: hypothetical protein WAQ22_01120 [Candidatus Saccharimonas sp.]